MNVPSSFDNHVFISYAHIDNERYSGQSQGWIDALHDNLVKRLGMDLGVTAKIWRDPKLAGNDVFNDTITSELSRSAVLVSVISPRYVKSESVRRELEDFFRVAAEGVGLRLNDKHRVFKVLKTLVPLDDQPAELRDLLGYEFYQQDQASGRPREFDYEISATGKDPHYWDKIADLSWDIKELLSHLNPSQSAQPLAPTSGMTVYLAETTSDLIEERDCVKRELQQYGHVVLPDKVLPLSGPAVRDTIRRQLSQCRLSVHLIGEYYGVIPEMETERSVVRLQQELAVERGDDTEFSRLIWMPPGLQPKDERQQKFVVDLQNSFSSRNGSELLQVKLEDLKTIIQSKLAKKVNPEAPAGQESSNARIYMVCDGQDIDALEPLQRYLLDQGYEAILPLLEGEPQEIFEDRKENLMLCDAVLIFQGRAGEVWLRAQVRELMKMQGYDRRTPLLGKAIYIGTPETQSKARFRTLEATVIRNYDNFHPASLTPFLAQIGRARGTR